MLGLQAGCFPQMSSELSLWRIARIDSANARRYSAARIEHRLIVEDRFDHWLKIKDPAAPAVKREAEEEWRR